MHNSFVIAKYRGTFDFNEKPRRDILCAFVFYLLCFVTAWLASIPELTYDPHGKSDVTKILEICAAVGPTVWCLILNKIRPCIEKPVWRSLGLGLGKRKRTLWISVFVLFITPILYMSIPIAAHYAGILDLPIQEPRVRWALLIGLIPSTAIFILPCLLEEIGWRGFLLPKFMPLGQLPALFLSGALWGFWHIPSKLAGINSGHPRFPFLYHFLYALVFFPLFESLFGVLVGWTRLKSGSIWPAVIMHAAYDCSVAVLPMFFAHGLPRDQHLLNSPLLSANPLHTSITGWPGWILLSVVIAIMVVCKQLPVKDPL